MSLTNLQRFTWKNIIEDTLRIGEAKSGKSEILHDWISFTLVFEKFWKKRTRKTGKLCSWGNIRQLKNAKLLIDTVIQTPITSLKKKKKVWSILQSNRRSYIYHCLCSVELSGQYCNSKHCYVYIPIINGQHKCHDDKSIIGGNNKAIK